MDNGSVLEKLLREMLNLEDAGKTSKRRKIDKAFAKNANL